MIEIHRRRFLTGLAGIIAAPSIVQASSLMAVRPWMAEGERWVYDAARIVYPDNMLVAATERYGTMLIDRRFGAALMGKPLGPYRGFARYRDDGTGKLIEESHA